MRATEDFAERDAFAALVGIRLLETSAGGAKAQLTVGPDHLNSVGILHGAAIFSLADFVFSVASNSHGNVALAINANISFLKAVSSGTLVAEAKEVSINPKLATYSVRVTTESGDLVATFQGMVYRKKDRHGE